MGVTYTDEGTDYPGLNQPSGIYVQEAEAEHDGEEVTWPQIHERASELQEADESVTDDDQ